MNLIDRVGKYVIFIFIFTFAFTGLILFLILYNVVNLRQSTQWVDHTYAVINELEEVFSTIQSAEIAQHNYLLSGNKTYLSQFNNAKNGTTNTLEQVTLLTSDNMSQQEKNKNLYSLVNTHFGILQQEIDEYNKNQTPVMRDNNYTQEENSLNNTRKALNIMEASENSLLQSRENTMTSIYAVVYVIAIAGGVFTLSLIFLAYYLVTLELNRRKTIEDNKDEFISMASHELKTPITSLKLFMEVVNRKLDKGDTVTAKNYIAKVDTQVNKLTKLISDLLDISRVQTGKMRIEKEMFNIDALIDETVETVADNVKKHEIEIEGSVTRTIEGDRYRIGQVVTNLLTNAIKYSPNGGKIIINSTSKDGFAVVSVKDSGIGIDKKYHHKIFDRLYQISDNKKSTYPGLGIGLYVCKEIIELHKGKIWVESEKGKGSTFSFSLPFS
ncbi:MAG TPA: ATP-binding protein [Patescibacteria group bacterium]|nr:ATP-binding protein [Patescibacteria group bacterium]